MSPSYIVDQDRLASVKVGTAQPTVFAYDADGQRVQTTFPDGTIVYTPFPDYEMTDPPGTGANTLRTTYRLAGQIVALQTKVGTAAGTYYYTYTDHLGDVIALSTTGGAFVTGSKARYDPFGTFTATPTGSNPSITNRGFTGHRHNNTGTYDLGLIYMNARYYVPEVGRFASPDTIIPDPANPQSYNRYSYTRNNPVNLNDPTGHRECGLADPGCGGGVGPATTKPVSPPQTFANPIDGFYSSGYAYSPGPRNDPRYHNGVDLASETTNATVALSTGRVRVADACANDPCGNDESVAANFGTGSVVIIEYQYDAIPKSIRDELEMTSDMSIYVQYQHLAEISSSIKVGGEVSANVVVGAYGNTGRSQGDHLHLEIHMGPKRALGIGHSDGTYDTQSNAWHDMNLIDPNLFWDIPSAP